MKQWFPENTPIKTISLSILIPVIPGFMTFTRDLYTHEETRLTPFIVAVAIALVFLAVGLKTLKARLFINKNFPMLLILIVALDFASTALAWRSILFDRHRSLQPLYYSLALSFALFSLAFFFAMNLFSKKTLKRLIFVYILIFLMFSTWFLVSNIERGWEGLVFYTGAMFYPTKYSFCALVITLIWGLTATFIPDRFFCKMNNRPQWLKIIFMTGLLLYVVAISAVPFVLKKYKIETLEKEEFVSGYKLTWGCNGYSNIDDTVTCVEEKFKSFKKKHRYETHQGPWFEDMITVKPKKEETFNSIKECHGKPPKGCYYAMDKMDSYKDVSLSSDRNYLVGYNMMLQSKGAYSPRHALGFLSGKNDVVVVKENGKYVVYQVSLYIINLTEEDALAQVNIMSFIEDVSTKKKLSTFILDKGYRFFVTGKKKDFASSAYSNQKDKNGIITSAMFALPEFDLAVSVDGRENPERMFIELGNDVYSFPLEKSYILH